MTTSKGQSSTYKTIISIAEEYSDIKEHIKNYKGNKSKLMCEALRFYLRHKDEDRSQGSSKEEIRKMIREEIRNMKNKDNLYKIKKDKVEKDKKLNINNIDKGVESAIKGFNPDSIG